MAFLAIDAGRAAASDWADAGEAAVRLVAAQKAVGQADVVILGLHIRLDPGWKTYWRIPGDAGASPRLDWTGPENIAAAEVLWPAPVRFSSFGIDSFGYVGEVVLPIRARLKRPGTPVLARLHVDYAFCKDVCIPGAANLTLALPAGPAEPTAEAGLIARYLARVPDRGGDGMRLVAARLISVSGDEMLELTARAARPFVRPDAMVEADGGFGFGRPETLLADGGMTARLRLPVTARHDAAPLAGRKVTVTLVDGDNAVEARLTVTRSGEALQSLR